MAEKTAERNRLVERKLFAGARVRRLRREQRLTQAAMAEALGISTSYLNLIERDQRPISAQILLQLVDVFDIDPRGLAGDEEARAQAQLHEVFSDPMFRRYPLEQGRAEGYGRRQSSRRRCGCAPVPRIAAGARRPMPFWPSNSPVTIRPAMPVR